jgi:hypothetical protein
MSTTTAIVLTVVVIIVLAAVAYLYLRDRRDRMSKQLRSRFGPEYSRAVEEAGDRQKAEAWLQRREKRVHSFSIHPLSAEEKNRFASSWRRVQADFVDDPKDAVTRADALLGEVMAARGYPVSDFDQRSADLSVDHPIVVQNYRAAHDIALKHQRGEAGTEELRQAMIHYRALFDELAGAPEMAHATH